MRWIGLGVTALVTSVSVVASCNFLVGVQDYCFDDACATTKDGGPVGDDGGPPDAADAGDAEAGPKPGTVLSALGFGDANALTVRSIAVSESTGDIFVTGRANGSVFKCENGDAGTPGLTGYLAELTPDGKCKWGFFFGDAQAEGVGVSVDDHDVVTLAGTFRGTLTLWGNTQTTLNINNTTLSSFVASFSVQRSINWIAGLYSQNNSGDVTATAVAANTSGVAVSVNYDSDLSVIKSGGASVTTVAMNSENGDAYVLRLDPTNGSAVTLASIPVTSTGTMQPQIISHVVMNSDGEVAFTGQSAQATYIASAMVPGPQTAGVLMGRFDANRLAQLQGIANDDAVQSGLAVAFDETNGIFVAGQFVGQFDPDAGVTVSNPGNTNHGLVVHAHGPNLVIDRAVQLGASSGATVNPSGILRLAGDAPGVVVTGKFMGSLGFMDQSPKSAVGKSDVFVIKINPMLQKQLWLRSFGVAGGTQAADAITADSKGNIFVAGHYDQELDFDKDIAPLPSKGTNSIFIVKMAP